jgi:uncharacterized protein
LFFCFVLLNPKINKETEKVEKWKFLLNFKLIMDKRTIWASSRVIAEADRQKRKKSGKKSKSHWSLFQKLLKYFVLFLKITDCYKKGIENAKAVKVNQIDIEFENLPKSFENYKILHLSDLHIDTLPGMENVIIEKIKKLKYDVCLITGDYRKDTHGKFNHILRPMQKLIKNIKTVDGIIGILGNHDSWLMVEPFEKMGIKMLINESCEIEKNNERMSICGTDDPYYYYSDIAIEALENAKGEFKIALIHTSEFFDLAAENNFQLYLCGHTHGGQICLPGGTPLITHQFEGKRFFKGLWKFKGLTGYTNVGCGQSGIPIRFNCPGEIALITLKCKKII